MIKTPSESSKTASLNSITDNAKSVLSLWRAILIGILLIPINVFWITIIEIRWYTLDGTSLPLFITPIFILFAVVALNLASKRIFPRRNKPLRQAELLLIYIMLVVSCTFAGHDTFQNMFGSISHPYWFASPENRWQSLFFRFLPSSLLITDQDALSAFYRGHVSIYGPDGRHYLMSWLVPLALWGVFFLVLLGMYLCLTILVRRGWIENERLTFPLVQLPLAMTADDAGKSFFKNPIMWAGFGVAFAISGLNGLHTLFPMVPELHVKLFQIQDFFVDRPWSAMGSTTTSFYPFAIGIAYFMPLDLSFSCWFFYIAARVFRIVGAVYGWDASSNAGFPYFGQQAAGAWIGLGIMLVYTGRFYWKRVLQMARDGAKSDEPAEAMRYRFAFLGLAVGTAALAAFSALVGLSAWAAVAFFGIVFLLGFVITRVRAELGAPHEIVWVNPEQLLVTVFGSHLIGAQNLTALSVLYWFNRGYRNHPMPNQLEAFKMMEGQKEVKFGGLITVLLIAAIVSWIAVDWANLHVTYADGAGSKALGFKSWPGAESYGRLAGWLTTSTPPDATGIKFLIGGALFVILLSFVRTNFAGWPLHPAGYALSVSYAMEYFWMPVLIAWALKAMILRYGGIKFYQSTVPFFLGLILGDYTMGSLWALIGPILGIQTYKIYI